MLIITLHYIHNIEHIHYHIKEIHKCSISYIITMLIDHLIANNVAVNNLNYQVDFIIYNISYYSSYSLS